MEGLKRLEVVWGFGGRFVEVGGLGTVLEGLGGDLRGFQGGGGEFEGVGGLGRGWGCWEGGVVGGWHGLKGIWKVRDGLGGL